ncbi:uncharacterized protein LOC115358399 [Myripristis murdjan]|nr:uncharacterized protein LOC115358399 [Myripristis murdjan]
MARNEEKQQGRLNRLWLQREREEGRIKDVHERRPKLSTLNSASSVKKWIPSIKSEIEYYLEQSQLSHYPERKIAEFQLCIEALEREYKSFITKLRVLDPSCKHKPWTPRAYAKRRADTQDSQSIVKKPRSCESHDTSGPVSGAQTASVSTWTGSSKTSADERQEHLSQSESRNPVPTEPDLDSSGPVCADQDQPLAFDHTRLAVAVAGFRGPSTQPSSSHTQSLARVLQSSLPNLCNSPLRQHCSTQNKDTAGVREDKAAIGLFIGQKGSLPDQRSGFGAAERIPERSSTTGTMDRRTEDVLGLGCYSSSDEECDT